ncbi:MAG: hypothetical protein ACR2J8_04820, partial [Thermomicrobiales bacterium]
MVTLKNNDRVASVTEALDEIGVPVQARFAKEKLPMWGEMLQLFNRPGLFEWDGPGGANTTRGDALLKDLIENGKGAEHIERIAPDLLPILFDYNRMNKAGKYNKQNAGGDLNTTAVTTLLKDLQKVRRNLSLPYYDEGDPDSIALSESSVMAGTVHGTKGLEAPVNFLMDMKDQIRDGAKGFLFRTGEESKDRNKVLESLRAAYVGVTRGIVTVMIGEENESGRTAFHPLLELAEEFKQNLVDGRPDKALKTFWQGNVRPEQLNMEDADRLRALSAAPLRDRSVRPRTSIPAPSAASSGPPPGMIELAGHSGIYIHEKPRTTAERRHNDNIRRAAGLPVAGTGGWVVDGLALAGGGRMLQSGVETLIAEHEPEVVFVPDRASAPVTDRGERGGSYHTINQPTLAVLEPGMKVFNQRQLRERGMTAGLNAPHRFQHDGHRTAATGVDIPPPDLMAGGVADTMLFNIPDAGARVAFQRSFGDYAGATYRQTGGHVEFGFNNAAHKMATYAANRELLQEMHAGGLIQPLDSGVAGSLGYVDAATGATSTVESMVAANPGMTTVHPSIDVMAGVRGAAGEFTSILADLSTTAADLPDLFS